MCDDYFRNLILRHFVHLLFFVIVMMTRTHSIVWRGVKLGSSILDLAPFVLPIQPRHSNVCMISDKLQASWYIYIYISKLFVQYDSFIPTDPLPFTTETRDWNQGIQILRPSKRILVWQTEFQNWSYSYYLLSDVLPPPLRKGNRWKKKRF